MVVIIIPILVIDIIPTGIAGVRPIITNGVSHIRAHMTVPVPVQNNKVLTLSLIPLLSLLPVILNDRVYIKWTRIPGYER